MKVTELNSIIENAVINEIKKTILSESEEGKKDVYHIMCDGVPLATFNNEDEATEALPAYKDKHKDGELIIEKGSYESQEDMIDKLDEMNDQLEETTDMNETDDSNAYDNIDSIQHELKEMAQRLFEKEKIDEQELYEIENIIDTDLEYYMDFDTDGVDVHRMFVRIVKDVAPHLVKKKKKENMENTQPMEGNEFSGALKAAKDAGEKTFTVDGKEYDVEECWSKQMEEELHGNQDKIDADKDGKISANDFKMLLKKKSDVDETEEECDECDGGMTSVNEGKKVLRLTESEMIKVIKQIVKESIPGLEALNKAKKGTETETNSHMADVEKEMKKQASFDGNDNPEFPKQVNKGEKAARVNSEKEDEEVADNRGGGMEDLDYTNEPSENFKKRLKMALEGDALMGNSQDAANVIKTDTGKNLLKKVLRKDKKEDEAPMYNKDVQPSREVNESSFKFSELLNEEISKMKNIASYNKKTQ